MAGVGRMGQRGLISSEESARQLQLEAPSQNSFPPLDILSYSPHSNSVDYL